jgi:hypothetical protein
MMSIIIQGYQIREITLGFPVNEPSKVLTVATQPLFTVVGGRVVITAMIGTAVGGTASAATSMQIATVPTVGAAVPLSTATVAAGVITVTVGSMISLVSPIAGVANPIFAGGATSGDGGHVAPAGTINLVTAGAVAGSMTWDLCYIPLDTGAYVTAV